LTLLIPRLYVILDAGLVRGPAEEIARQLMDTGVRLLQYRARMFRRGKPWRLHSYSPQSRVNGEPLFSSMTGPISPIWREPTGCTWDRMT